MVEKPVTAHGIADSPLIAVAKQDVTNQSTPLYDRPPQMIRPKKDRVLVRVAPELTEIYGLAISEDSSMRDRPTEGIVLDKGQGRLMQNGVVVPVEFQVGDRVLFAMHAGYLLPLSSMTANIRVLGWREGDQYKILREDEVMALIEPATEKELTVQAEVDAVYQAMVALEQERVPDRAGEVVEEEE